MGVPAFLLRKLYKRGSLKETRTGFHFTLQNPLGTATLIAPPRIVVNGMSFAAADMKVKGAEGVEVAALSADAPYVFRKGTQLRVGLPGRLLRGGNRIHVVADTKEFGRIDFLVEDREAEYCDIDAEE